MRLAAAPASRFRRSCPLSCEEFSFLHGLRTCHFPVTRPRNTGQLCKSTPFLCGRPESQQQNTRFAHPRRAFATSAPVAGATTVRAYIGLGSNLGDRLHNIEQACHKIDALPSTRIMRTSGLYETAAMYVTDQDNFLNGVCEVRRVILFVG